MAKIEPPKNTDGISFLPTLRGQEQPEHEYLYWEFPEYDGQQAVRMGVWKGIRQNIDKGNLEIELYNLEHDEEEQFNAADQFPEVVEKIKAIMTSSHRSAELDRFKMQVLGDVKTSLLE